LEYAPRHPDHAAVFADLSTPNSTACRSAFQRASSGKVENMATALPIELAIWQNTPHNASHRWQIALGVNG
jgi:hypothetical protein